MFRPIGLIAVLALLFAACSPSTDTTTTAAVETSVAPSGSETIETTTTVSVDDSAAGVVVGVGRPIRTLNPFADGASSETRIAGQAVWATVYDVEPETWERIPDTVVSLPSQTPGAIEVAEDGSMTVRYEIQSGATWSDGVPITGADIAFTADAMFQLAVRGAPDIDSIMSKVTGTDSVERIAWITFSEASLAFEDALWVILPAHVIDDVAELKVVDGMDWPSGGPFMLAAEQASNALHLERNPYYWKTGDGGEQLPYFDRLTFLSGNEPGSEVDLFTSRSADVIVVPVGQSDRRSVEGAVSQGAELQEVPSPVVEHLTFQFGAGREAVNPLSGNDSLDYRRAIAYSIDRPALLEEEGVPWMSGIPGMLIPRTASAWDVYPYSVDEGRTLFEEVAGEGEASEAPRAVLSTTDNDEYRVLIGDSLVGSFAAVGIRTDTDYVDSMVFFGDSIGRSEFDIGMWAWLPDGGYASQLALMQLLDPASAELGSNYGNWGAGASASEGTAEFSELVIEAKSIVDPIRFAEIVLRAEELLAEYLPLIPLYQRASLAAIWPDSVAGVVHNASSSTITWNVETWQEPDK